MRKPSLLNRLLAFIWPETIHGSNGVGGTVVSYNEIPDDNWCYVGVGHGDGSNGYPYIGDNFYIDDGPGGHIFSDKLCQCVKKYRTRQSVLNDWGMTPRRVRIDNFVDCREVK